MKKFYLFIISLVAIFTLTSCIASTYAATQDDIYVEVQSNFSYETIVMHGTPYYYNGVISYYYYNGLYYYPYLWDNCWYFQPFRHVHHNGYIFRPGRYHRPQHHLGDIKHHHPRNFGNNHHDGYRDRGHFDNRGHNGNQTHQGNRGNNSNQTHQGNRGNNGNNRQNNRYNNAQPQHHTPQLTPRSSTRVTQQHAAPRVQNTPIQRNAPVNNGTRRTGRR